jgi:hypothetical protein
MKAVSSFFFILAISVQLSVVMSFTLRRGVAAFTPLVGRRLAPSATLRWMSTQDPPAEKTEEEKVAIKAARDARK